MVLASLELLNLVYVSDTSSGAPPVSTAATLVGQVFEIYFTSIIFHGKNCSTIWWLTIYNDLAQIHCDNLRQQIYHSVAVEQSYPP